MPRMLEHGPRRSLAGLRHRIGGEIWPVAVVAGLTFLLAYDRGGFSLSARATVAIAAWWALLVGVGLGVWPRTPVPRAAQIVAGLLAAFALWTVASVLWTRSAENAFVEFNRITMYLAVFLISVLACARWNVSRWADGLAIGIGGIALLALVSRLFPATFSLQGFPTFLPDAATRLSFPVGYWNGLAILVALGYPLWLGIAVRAKRWWARGAALMPFPSFAVVVYLTSSRGGVAAALIGVVTFLATTAQRWRAAGALLGVAAGSAAAIVVVAPRDELVDGPLNSHAASSQGHWAFLLILGVSVCVSAFYALLNRRGVSQPPRALARVLLVGALLAVVAVAVASHPLARFDTFKEVPAPGQVGGPGYVQTHLLSGAGSGRWQFWTAAVKEWESAPAIGRGAGSYQAWWAEHASFSYVVRNAHSLYLEVLGELGLIGFLLLTAAFAYGAVIAVKNTLARDGEERILAASLLGVLSAFYVGAATEWIWQLTVVSAVALVALGLLTGPAGSPVTLRQVEAGRRGHRAPRFAVGATVLLVGWCVICAQAIPWLADLQIRASEAAIRRNDGESALRHALNAKMIQPWAASPYLQLALVQERRRKLREAADWNRQAISRNPIDWRLWLVEARLEAKRGALLAANRALDRAIELNPKSPLFAGLRRSG